MASDYGADAIFTGAGGDNVFGYLTSAAPIVDALRFEGAGAAWRVAGDLARVMNDNVWKALRLALRKMVVAGPNGPVDTSFCPRVSPLRRRDTLGSMAEQSRRASGATR